MNYKKRLLEPKLKALSQHFPAIVLTGARQVGKSTLLKYLLPEAEHVTFDPIIDIGNARQDPELFLSHMRTPVILDEIQYSPEILPVIKRYADQNKIAGQYWITGSQHLSMLKNVSESLAGRAAVLSLYPMTLAEQYDDASAWIVDYLKDTTQFLNQSSLSRVTTQPTQTLARILWKGGYPGLMQLQDDLQNDALNSYLQTYIERDVRLLSDISDLQEFSRFVQLLANLTAQEINFMHLGREIGISPQTANRWVNVLKSSYQWIELPAYSNNTLKRVSTKNKGYFIDTGMAAHLMHISTPNALLGHPKLGALFETYVVNDILRQLPLLQGSPAVYHWRSHGGAELDLLIEIDDVYYPIEIKCKTRPTKSDLRGIQAFRQAYPQLKFGPALLICAIDRIMPLGEDSFAVPFDGV